MSHGTTFNATLLRETLIRVTWQSIHCNNAVRIWSLFKPVPKSFSEVMLHRTIFNHTFYRNLVAQKIDTCNIASADDF